MEPTLSSGSVVFSIVHLREAIFWYHAHGLAQQRIKKLEAIERKVQPGFWSLASSSTYGHGSSDPKTFFASRLEAFGTGSNILGLLHALGLQPASYLEFLETHMRDVSLWLAACSSAKSSRKWMTPDGRMYRLGALSTSDPSTEHAGLTATEMLYHAGGGNSRRVYSGWNSSWGDLEGFAQVVRDRNGRIYLARILNTRHQRFPFEAAARLPELLYSSNTPFLPYYEILEYSKASSIGMIITECPPWALSQSLMPGQSQQRDELRRVLERMRDLFAHLVKLEDQGISLNRKPDPNWVDSFLTSRPGPWIVSAYLKRAPPAQLAGRLTRNDSYEERLPDPPGDAWPLAPLEGEGGMAGLPWSQLTAYSDPRVEGPATYLHGVLQASFDDSDQSWTGHRYRYGHDFTYNVQPISRHHNDLLSIVECILPRFFPLSDVRYDKVIKLLEAGTPAKAYEDSLANGADSGPRNPASGHSGLFSFCVNCIFKTRRGKLTKLDRGPDRCSVCSRHCMVNAMPKAIQDLLLRIIKPQTREDGTAIIVTAREALATIESVMATELPKMTSVYEGWAQNQPRVERIDTVDPLPLDKIRADARAERWLLFEHLRGSFLDAKFTRVDRKQNRDLVKAYLASKQEQGAKAESKVVRQELETTEAADAVACDANSPLTDAEEVEVPLTATQEEAKKRGGGEDAEQATSKKMKTA